ncbi:MAG TPA: RNA polymerase sigma factor [Pseudomonadales bacterium]
MTPAETHPDPDPALLVEQASKGDQQAFEALYRQTCSLVYGLCLRLTANRALAEECVQQTYVQAWRHLQAFRGDSSVTTWLHRIAVNEVRAQFRRESRHDSEEITEGPIGAGTDVGQIMDMERAISTLPERARAVFVLVGVYGYPHEEAAALLGMAVGTSKAHFHHARRQLRSLLGDST